MIKLKVVAVFLASLMAMNALAQSQEEEVIDDVVAIVGEDLILKSQIESGFLDIYYQNKGNVTPDARCGVLDQIILNKVLKTHALRDSLVVAPDEIEYQLESRWNVLVNQVNSEEDLIEYYGKTKNQILAGFRPLVIDYLLAEKMKDKVTEKVRVTPAEVKRFFGRLPEESLPLYNAEVELAQIVVYPKPTDEEQNRAMEMIESLRKRALSGENFEDLIKEYSQEPGAAESGGDLGYFKKGEMVKEFEEVAFKLAPGEISRIVETEFGLHIIQVIDRRKEAVRTRHLLLTPQIADEQTEKVKQTMDKVYRQIKGDSLIFEYAVALYSEDEQTKKIGGLLFNPQTGTSYFDIDQLLEHDPNLYAAIADLEKEDISEPFLFTDAYGRKGYRILYVQNQRNPHRMNLEDDFDVIKSRALAFKKQETLYSWLDGATSDIFISIDDLYRSCPNTPLWLRRNQPSN